MNKLDSRIIRYLAVKAGYKYGIIVCNYLQKDGTPCEGAFVAFSDTWYSHLLFKHGKYDCRPKEIEIKMKEKAIVEGFGKRVPIRKERILKKWCTYTDGVRLRTYDLPTLIKCIEK